MGLTREKKHGIHYTPTDLAAFLAEQIAQRLPNSRRDVTVLDPACGDGELLEALARAVPASVRERLTLVGYDTDHDAVVEASRNLSGLGVKAVDVSAADFLSLAAVDPSMNAGLFAQQAERTIEADVIISNPPYVRTQVLGAEQAQQLARRFGLAGRVDLYHAFTMAMLSVLAPDGIIGLLTSNRFLVTKAGATMRRLLHDRLDLLAVFDLGDTKLFEAAVLPAILIGRHAPGRKTDSCDFTRVYQADKDAGGDDAAECASVLDALRDGLDGTVRTEAGLYKIEKGTLSITADGTEPWFMTSGDVDAWMGAVASRTACRFIDVAEIRVGIKTTADKVFIRDDWDTLDSDRQPEEKLLHPLLTHHVAQRWNLPSSGRDARKRVLYPHEIRNGRRSAVKLEEYPRAARYLESHRERLEGRTYVIEGGRNWYEIWVPHDPADWAKPKVVCPDISVKPCFFLDRQGQIVNGDCYWMTLRPGQAEEWLLLILAVANSSFIERFYDTKFHNKLYAGRRRFITQYVSEFPLPDLDSPPAQRIVGLVRQLLDETDDSVRHDLETRLDEGVWRAFGVGPNAPSA
ncbi:MAG: Modification methylase PaeR7I [Planctomycetes bacterium ADurb.Bin126]|nr:MAG: Modification methylase PaeR7I [Planctomycetes bacterium ADurb.Bin126]